MQYAIYRHKKLRTMGQIAASSAHMSRSCDVFHAYSSRKNSNIVLAGSHDPKSDVEKLLQKVKKIRKNNVLAIEVMLTASPEFFQNSSTDEELAEWISCSYAWLQNTYGAENIAHAQVHMDERSPHITGFVVPIDNGKLNAKKWCGGREKCSMLQTSYAAAVSHLGLSRGIRGSVAKHHRVRRHYAQIDSNDVEVSKVYASERSRRIAMQITAQKLNKEIKNIKQQKEFYEKIANEYMQKMQMIANNAVMQNGKMMISNPNCIQLLESLQTTQTTLQKQQEKKTQQKEPKYGI